MPAGQLARVRITAAVSSTAGWPPSTPTGLPSHIKLILIDVVGADGRPERGAHLGIGEPGREGGVTSVPQLRRQIAAVLLRQQLHQGTGFEVDQRRR